jgi:outer membrane receptor protein involved in Fe transport
VSFDVLFDAPGVPADVSRSRDLDVRPSGRQAYVYGTLRSDLSDRFAIDVGVRVQDQDLEEASRATIGPRLGMRYALTPRMAVRASFGRVFQSQGINELQVSDGVTGFFRPQRSEHFVVGLDRQLAREALLRIEIYEKSMASLRPRYENLINTRVLLPELKPDRLQIWPDSARARGLEVSVEGGRDGLRWWGNLGWARVSDRIDGESVLRSWDQTWSLSTGFELTVRDWSLSSGLIYRSGWPTTPVALDADAAFPTIRAGQRNSLRMRPYGTLDVRLSREIRFDASRLSVFLELANLTGRENPCCFEYEIGDEDEAGLLVLDEQPYFPRIPSLGFTWAF